MWRERRGSEPYHITPGRRGRGNLGVRGAGGEEVEGVWTIPHYTMEEGRAWELPSQTLVLLREGSVRPNIAFIPPGTPSV